MLGLDLTIKVKTLLYLVSCDTVEGSRGRLGPNC